MSPIGDLFVKLRGLTVKVLAALFLVPTLLSSQWIRTNGPEGGFADHLVAGPSGLVAALSVSPFYDISYSTNSGISWSLSTFTSVINDLTFHNGTFYAGTSKGLYASATGATWSLVNNVFADSAVSALAADTSGLYLFTPVSGLYRSTDNGTSWTSLSFGGQPSFGRIALEVKDGAFFLFFDVNAVAVDSAGRVFIGTNRGIEYSTNNGSSWDTSGLRGFYVQSIVFSKSGTVLAGTHRGVFSSTDNGTSWNGTGFTGLVFSMAVDSAGAVVLGTTSGIYRSTDNGMNWSRSNNGLRSEWVWSLLSANSFLFAGKHSGISRTSDQGASWTEAGLDGEEIAHLASDGFRIYAGTRSGVYVSTNNGGNWSSSRAGLSDTSIWSLAAVADGMGGTRVFAGTSRDGVFLSTDFGNTWTPAGFAGNSVGGLAPIDSLLFAIVEVSVARSTDHGANWEIVLPAQPGQFVGSIAGIGSNILAANYPVGVLLSTDYGTTWNPSNVGVGDVYPRRIFARGSDFFLGTNLGKVFLSRDTAKTWTMVDSGLPNDMSIRAIESDGQNLYLGTIGRGVWKRPLAEFVTSVTVMNDRGPSTFRLVQNFPNPFNPTTNIEFSVEASGAADLRIYGILGEEAAAVYTGEAEAGRVYRVTFDASGFPAGVYFARLRSGGNETVRKLLLVK